MQAQDKFYNDARRVVSRDCDKECALKELKRLFIASSPDECSKCGLSEDLFSFWAENYGENFQDTYEKLGEISSLLYGDEEQETGFSPYDWGKIREIVSSYGDCLDLNFLTDVMNIILKHWKI